VQEYQAISCHITEDSSVRMSYLFPWRHQYKLETFEKTYLHDEITFVLFDKKTLQHMVR
jgi:hypothetical protein